MLCGEAGTTGGGRCSAAERRTSCVAEAAAQRREACAAMPGQCRAASQRGLGRPPGGSSRGMSPCGPPDPATPGALSGPAPARSREPHNARAGLRLVLTSVLEWGSSMKIQRRPRHPGWRRPCCPAGGRCVAPPLPFAEGMAPAARGPFRNRGGGCCSSRSPAQPGRERRLPAGCGRDGLFWVSLLLVVWRRVSAELRTNFSLGRGLGVENAPLMRARPASALRARPRAMAAAVAASAAKRIKATSVITFVTGNANKLRVSASARARARRRPQGAAARP